MNKLITTIACLICCIVYTQAQNKDNMLSKKEQSIAAISMYAARGNQDSLKVILARGLDCRFNLIRFHQIPDIPLQGVDDEKMEQFRDYLTQHGVFTTIRASRGQDIYAACGLLSTSKKIGEIREHEDEEKMNK